MNTNKLRMPAEVLQFKLSAQQRRDFEACAGACGLDLVDWILECADVQAAAAIDAMQAPLRGQRPSRKKQRPRQSSTPAPQKALKGATMEAARSFNARFRRPPNERQDEARDGATSR